MERGNDPSELLNALDEASCLDAAAPDRRVGVVSEASAIGSAKTRLTARANGCHKAAGC